MAPRDKVTGPLTGAGGTPETTVFGAPRSTRTSAECATSTFPTRSTAHHSTPVSPSFDMLKGVPSYVRTPPPSSR